MHGTQSYTRPTTLESYLARKLNSTQELATLVNSNYSIHKYTSKSNARVSWKVLYPSGKIYINQSQYEYQAPMAIPSILLCAYIFLCVPFQNKCPFQGQDFLMVSTWRSSATKYNLAKCNCKTTNMLFLSQRIDN